MGDIVWLSYHGDVLEIVEFDVDIRRRLRRRQHALTGKSDWVPLGLTANWAGRAIGQTVAGFSSMTSTLVRVAECDTCRRYQQCAGRQLVGYHGNDTERLGPNMLQATTSGGVVLSEFEITDFAGIRQAGLAPDFRENIKP
ncbi:hypothetical protein ACM16X_17835 [Haloarcula japonica]